MTEYEVIFLLCACVAALGLVLNRLDRMHDQLRNENKRLRAEIKRLRALLAEERQ